MCALVLTCIHETILTTSACLHMRPHFLPWCWIHQFNLAHLCPKWPLQHAFLWIRCYCYVPAVRVALSLWLKKQMVVCQIVVVSLWTLVLFLLIMITYYQQPLWTIGHYWRWIHNMTSSHFSILISHVCRPPPVISSHVNPWLLQAIFQPLKPLQRCCGDSRRSAVAPL